MIRFNKTCLTLLLLLIVLILSFFVVRFSMKQYYTNVYPTKYEEYVVKYATAYDVDVNLVYAIIHTESSFVTDAESNVKARGLMQIMEDTFEWAKNRMQDETQISYDDLYDAETNIKYGTYILNLLLDEFKTEDTAIAAYHAGWGNVKKWLKDPEKSKDGTHINAIPFHDTDEYVAKVKQTKQVYEHLYNTP